MRTSAINVALAPAGERLSVRPGRRFTFHPSRRRAFSLLEVMVAIFIFSLVLTAIYSIWIGILRGRRAVETTLSEVQRSRIAMHAIEDAFLTVLMCSDNAAYYAFVADTSGDDAYVSMVSRLPASYPGVGRYAGGQLVVRRVSFSTESGSKGKDLVMTQAPMLLDTNQSGGKAYSLVLAKDVNQFGLEFWDAQKGEWAEEWLSTNQLPKMVRITLGLGKTTSQSSDSHDLVSRIVAIPAMAVIGAAGQPVPGMQPGMGMPGMGQPGLNQPGGMRTVPKERILPR